MKIDLSGMSRKELEKLQKDVQKELDRAARDEIKIAREEARKIAAAHGFTLAELAQGAPKGKAAGPKAPAKYRNKANPEQSWSGRGRKPQWVKDIEESGGNLEDHAI